MHASGVAQVTFSCRTPTAFISSKQAMPAEPAPLQTTFTSDRSRPVRLHGIDQPRGRDDRRAVLIVVENRNVHQSRAAGSSMMKQSGALMSSRLMPPKEGPR